MAVFLAYIEPVPGRLYPLVPTLEELSRRGRGVAVRSGMEEVRLLHTLDIRAEPLATEIVHFEPNDWRARTRFGALISGLQQFGERARFQVPDLQRAIETERPDVLLIDETSWGAAAAAERSGLPWAFCLFSPVPIPSRNAPPFGLGLAPRRDPLGRLRDRVAGPVVLGILARIIASHVNGLRAHMGLVPLHTLSQLYLAASLVLVSCLRCSKTMADSRRSPARRSKASSSTSSLQQLTSTRPVSGRHPTSASTASSRTRLCFSMPPVLSVTRGWGSPRRHLPTVFRSWPSHSGGTSQKSPGASKSSERASDFLRADSDLTGCVRRCAAPSSSDRERNELPQPSPHSAARLWRQTPSKSSPSVSMTPTRRDELSLSSKPSNSFTHGGNAVNMALNRSLPSSLLASRWPYHGHW
jgi:hypothetical protein